MLAFEILLSWYLGDAFFTRHELEHGPIRIRETPTELGIRFWRRIGLLGTIVLALGAVLIALSELSGEESIRVSAGHFLIPEKALPTLATTISVFIAAFGWMYTTFERERADRSAATLKAVNDQLHTDYVRGLYDEIVSLTKHIRNAKNIDPKLPLPVDFMDTEVSVLPTHSAVTEHRCRCLGVIVDDYFNVLENLAYSVRRGQLELKTMDRVLRPRLIRFAVVFSDYIATSTEAKPDSKMSGRMRATNRIWEHYLWLVSELHRVEEEDADIASKFVLPPRAG